jgi:hypothetical protein
MKIVKLSAIRTGRLYLQEVSLVLTSVTVRVEPRATGPLKILSMKNSNDIFGNRTLRFVAQGLKQLGHRYSQKGRLRTF